MADRPVMEVSDEDITTLVLDDRNARRGDVSALAESLREFGQHRPIVARRDTRQVIVGNHMLLAAQSLGWPSISVHWVDDDDQQALRRSLSDNLIADRSKWEKDQLSSLLGEIDEPLNLPGTDAKLLDQLLADTEPVVLEEPVYPIVAKPGEHFSYVMIVATNLIDSMWIESNFPRQRERFYKSPTIKESWVIDVPRFRELFGLEGDDRPDAEILAEAAARFVTEVQPDPDAVVEDDADAVVEDEPGVEPEG